MVVVLGLPVQRLLVQFRFKTEGKCGSVIVTLMPAPLGTKLTAEKKCSQMLEMAGIKDIYMKSRGENVYPYEYD